MAVSALRRATWCIVQRRAGNFLSPRMHDLHRKLSRQSRRFFVVARHSRHHPSLIVSSLPSSADGATYHVGAGLRSACGRVGLVGWVAATANGRVASPLGGPGSRDDDDRDSRGRAVIIAIVVARSASGGAPSSFRTPTPTSGRGGGTATAARLRRQSARATVVRADDDDGACGDVNGRWSHNNGHDHQAAHQWRPRVRVPIRDIDRVSNRRKRNRVPRAPRTTERHQHQSPAHGAGRESPPPLLAASRRASSSRRVELTWRIRTASLNHSEGTVHWRWRRIIAGI